MAITLSKTNIINGNIIQAADVTQSIDAFTGIIAYDITLSGSLQLTGSVKSRNGYTGSLQGTASVATTTISASYALNATTATSTTSASYALNATTATSTTSASYALSSSYAVKSTTADSVSNQNYDGDIFSISTFNFVAGKVVLSSGVGSSSAFPVLIGKRISREAFITATYKDGFVFANPIDSANLMTSVTPDGRVAIIQQSPSVDNGDVMFTGIYI